MKTWWFWNPHEVSDTIAEDFNLPDEKREELMS
jgi:hypothetical protein